MDRIAPTRSASTFSIALAAVLAAEPVSARIVNWTVDSNASYVRLNLPDQPVSFGSFGLDTSDVFEARVRDDANATDWTDAGGRRASLGGSLTTNLQDGTSVEFLSGQQNVFALESFSVRPNPEVDERYVSELSIGQPAVIYGRSLGERREPGHVVAIKKLRGNKTIFTRDAAERKDLDVLQVFVEPVDPFCGPVGLQVDVDVLCDLTVGELSGHYQFHGPTSTRFDSALAPSAFWFFGKKCCATVLLIAF